MELVLDAIILLFWATFFLATFLGVFQEYQHSQSQTITNPPDRLDDDDPVYIMGPSLRD